MMDAAEIAKLREGLTDGCLLDGDTARSLLDALEAAEAKLKSYDGIDDPDAARKAMDTVASLDSGSLVKLAKVEEIRAEAKRRGALMLFAPSSRRPLICQHNSAHTKKSTAKNSTRLARESRGAMVVGLSAEKLKEIEDGLVSVTPGPWRVAGKKTIRSGDGWIGDMHWRNGAVNAAYLARCDPDTIRALVAMAKANAGLAEALRAARADIIKTIETFFNDEPETDKVIVQIDAALEAAGLRDARTR